jgi:hypothetical protein
VRLSSSIARVSPKAYRATNFRFGKQRQLLPLLRAKY